MKNIWQRGFWTAVTIRGVPVRLHWSLPVGAFVFGSFGLVPAFWVAFATLLLLHELGHALIAKRFGHSVDAIELTGVGGLCRWSGEATEYENGAIAWGGVMAQALVLAVAVFLWTTAGPAESAVAIQLVHAFITINAVLIALNLLPIPPLDGAEAWAWVGRRIRSRRSRANARELEMLDVVAPAIEPPRGRIEPRTTPLPRVAPAPAPKPRPPLESDADLAALLKSIAEEAREQHQAAE